MMTRVIFMGTPAFAVPSLERLHDLADVEIVQVVTQPDRPAGRGRALRPSAVKARAQALDLPVWTPERLRGETAEQRLRELAAELFVVVAYGEILRPAVLAIPPRGAINVHASLLPRHRGAAPVAGALLAGDEETGVTIMLMDEGMDTGPILRRRAVPVRRDHSLTTLSDELATVGAELLAETLPGWIAGEITPQPQDHEAATYTKMIRKADGRLDWEQPARALANRVRAFDPWPGTFTSWQGKQLKILQAEALPGPAAPPDDRPPGTVARADDRVAVATGEGWLALGKVQLAGKKAMDAMDFVNGYQDFVGSVLGEADGG